MTSGTFHITSESTVHSVLGFGSNMNANFVLIELPRVPDHALAGGGAEQRQQHVFVVRILEKAVGQG